MVHSFWPRAGPMFVTSDIRCLSTDSSSCVSSAAGWTGEPGILDVLVCSHTGPTYTARVIWGPDPEGLLSTGFMLSIDSLKMS